MVGSRISSGAHHDDDDDDEKMMMGGLFKIAQCNIAAFRGIDEEEV